MSKIETIAVACHEINRLVQHLAGEEVSPSWEEAPAWQRESAIEGVRNVLERGYTPEQSHEGWLEYKRATGWTYGSVKDEEAKTHPCMVPYGDLPPAQQAKDHIFVAVASSLAHVVSE